MCNPNGGMELRSRNWLGKVGDEVGEALETEREGDFGAAVWGRGAGAACEVHAGWNWGVI